MATISPEPLVEDPIGLTEAPLAPDAGDEDGRVGDDVEQWAVKAVFMRGGTSKALVFHARDLPLEPARRDALLRAALGSPDPYGRQLDGMGGGLSSVSKACIVAPSTRTDADIDFTFAQVAIREPVVDLTGTCGNMAAALGAFAVDEGLVAAPDGTTTVRVYNTNLDQRIDLSLAVAGGRALVAGDLAIPGVAGTGAGVRVAFLEPGGKGGHGVLPTGGPRCRLERDDGREIEASLVDSAGTALLVSAQELGLDGTETPGEWDARGDILAQIEHLRRTALVQLGRATDHAAAAAMLGALRVAVVAPPRDYVDLAGRRVAAADHDLLVRVISAGQAHRAVPVSMALGLATAARLEGTLAAAIAGIRRRALRLGTPSGVVTAEADVRNAGINAHVASASIWRTARRLMQGDVLIPTTAVSATATRGC